MDIIILTPSLFLIHLSLNLVIEVQALDHTKMTPNTFKAQSKGRISSGKWTFRVGSIVEFGHQI